MNAFLKTWIVALLEQALRDVKADRCNMSEAECQSLFDALANIKLNKNQAAEFVHLSQSQFDNEVAVGRIPEGRKLYRGDTHKYWSKRELINYLNTWRKNHGNIQR